MASAESEDIGAATPYADLATPKPHEEELGQAGEEQQQREQEQEQDHDDNRDQGQNQDERQNNGQDEGQQQKGQEQQQEQEQEAFKQPPPSQMRRRNPNAYRMKTFWDVPLRKWPGPDSGKRVKLVLAAKGECKSILDMVAPAVPSQPTQRRRRRRWARNSAETKVKHEGGDDDGDEYLGGIEPEVDFKESDENFVTNGGKGAVKFEDQGGYGQEDDSYFDAGGGGYFGDEDQDQKGNFGEGGQQEEEPVMLHYAPNIDEVMDGYYDDFEYPEEDYKDYEGYTGIKGEFFDDEEEEQFDEDDYLEDDYDDDEEDYKPARGRGRGRRGRPPLSGRGRGRGRGRGKSRDTDRIWISGNNVMRPTGVGEEPGEEPAVPMDPEATELYFLKIDDYMVAEAAKRRDMDAYNKTEEGDEDKKPVVKQEVDEKEGNEEGDGEKEEKEGDEEAEEGKADADEDDMFGSDSNKSRRKLKLADRRLYGCPYCGFVHMKQKWVNHLKKKHADKNLIFCTKNRMCYTPFQSEEMMAKHFKEVHQPTNDRECPKCDKVYKFPCELRAHMNSHLDVSQLLLWLSFITMYDEFFVCFFTG